MNDTERGQTKRPSAVLLEKIQSVLCGMNECITSLEGHCEPILMNPTPEVCGSEPEDIPAESPLCSDLRGLLSEVERTACRLESLRSRCSI